MDLLLPPAGVSADISTPPDAGSLSEVVALTIISRSTHSPSHTASTSFPCIPSGSIASPQQSFPSHHSRISLNSTRYHFQPDIVSAAVRHSSCCSLSSGTEAQYRQQRRSSQHGVTLALPSPDSAMPSTERGSSTADSTIGFISGHCREEPSQELMATMPTRGVHASM